jgi:hypothetical protein
VNIVVHDHEKNALPRVPDLVRVVCDLPDISAAKVHNDGLKRNSAIRLEEFVLFESQSYRIVNVCRNGTRSARYFFATSLDDQYPLASGRKPASAGCVTEVPKAWVFGPSVC